MKKILPLLVVLLGCASASGNMIITAVFDGPITGGLPKGLELYVLDDIPDLTLYGIGSANNGGGSDGQEFTFPAGSATAGSFLYVASEAPQFTAFFGFAPSFTGGAANVNGDDAIELFNNGSVVDTYGQIDVNGDGTPWDYTDGWAYRNNGTAAAGLAWQVGDWTYSGINVLDGETSNATAANPVPLGTFVSIPEPSAAALLLLGCALLGLRRR